jgi:hypothetical protein
VKEREKKTGWGESCKQMALISALPRWMAAHFAHPPVLRSAVVALAHAAARVVRFPKPPQDVHEGDFCGVVHHAHAFRVARAPAARLYTQCTAKHNARAENCAAALT